MPCKSVCDVKSGNWTHSPSDSIVNKLESFEAYEMAGFVIKGKKWLHCVLKRGKGSF